MAHRFKDVNISAVTIHNHKKLLPESLINQVSVFLPPNGSFDSKCLRRYLEPVSYTHLTLPTKA